MTTRTREFIECDWCVGQIESDDNREYEWLTLHALHLEKGDMVLASFTTQGDQVLHFCSVDHMGEWILSLPMDT